jgi:Uma2 family endonuclease
MLNAQGVGQSVSLAADQGPSEYLVNDGMGRNGLELMICDLLMQVFNHYFASRNQMVLVGSDQYIHYREGDFTAHVAPDLYVIEDEPLGVETVACWKVWEHEDKVPTLAIEVVSNNWHKDYDPEDIERRYQALGVKELVRYDPQCKGYPRLFKQGKRQLLAHWVRTQDGRLEPQALEAVDRVRLVHFPITLRHVPPHTLRPYGGPDGSRRLLTRAEDEEQRRKRAERRIEIIRQKAAAATLWAESESRRATAEAERAAALEQENKALLAELARLRGQKPE